MKPALEHRHWGTNRHLVAILVCAAVGVLLIGTDGFRTYLFKERRLIAAGNEIAAAIKKYKDSSPGTVKEYPLALADVLKDPRMLGYKSYIDALPVDPVTGKMQWGEINDPSGHVIGAHSLSEDSPSYYARVLSLRSGERYSDWRFVAE